jgi:hypothetical protein
MSGVDMRVRGNSFIADAVIPHEAWIEGGPAAADAR